ncbi:RHS repeat-associated core domain-containing protein [Pseudomonas faucium]|uniref:RHS repeat-associated core domain-containing protein n=1 Tax=Pseudomonas faucium TaxID=2740518 RepID=UPI0039C4691E
MKTHLLVTDMQRSVLTGLHAYSPYGFMNATSETALGFCGQHRHPLTGNYPLGNGRRFFNPTLMRFMSYDSLSPFSRGGLNGYAYCGGDPVNRTDETGQYWIRLLTQLAFGSSALAGTGNMVVSRMRARINNVALPTGAVEPSLPRLHPHVLAAANIADTYAYSTSLIIRGPRLAETIHPGSVAGLQPVLDGADLTRATSGFLGFAALPMNARHEWRRAGVRNMPRGRLIGEAVLDAYGVSYLWRGVRHAAQAVGMALSGVARGLVARVRGRRRTGDVETGIDDTRL